MSTAMRLMLLCLLFPAIARAQTIPGDVTFEVPLNLTRLAADITKIDVSCGIESSALGNTRLIRGQPVSTPLAGRVEVPVVNGRVVQTVRVVVAISPGTLQDPTGKTATYTCALTGYSVGIPDRYAGWSAGWDRFLEDHEKSSFRLSPTPAEITGSFTW